MPGEEPSGEFKYWAFISYSHADSDWANWLHKSLETYRVPKRLVGKPARNHGIVPERPYPVFRDRDELPGSANLGENLTLALRQSRYLIVICSPRAATSQWVDQEVKIFKAMGREDRVLCLIVDGEPNASHHPELGLQECFPEAVRYWVDPDRQITTIPTEPIAADLRKGKDGKHNALLKLLAGVLGVNFDDLKQRDSERKYHQLQLILSGVVILLLIFVVLGILLYQGKQEAIRARDDKDTALKNESTARTNAVAQEKIAKQQEKIAKEQESIATNALKQTSEALVEKAKALTDAEAARDAKDKALVEKAKALTDAEAARDAKDKALKEKGVALKEAEAARNKAQHILSLSDFSEAARLVNEGSPSRSLAYLAHALRSDSNNVAALALTTSLLEQKNWILPKVRPFVHNQPVTKASISADGHWILAVSTVSGAASKDKLHGVRVWDAVSGNPGSQMDFAFSVKDACFSPDGKWVVTALSDGTAQVWDTLTSKAISAPMKLERAIESVSFSPDGKWVATASDKKACIWEAATGKQVSEPDSMVLPAGGSLIRFSPDGKLVAVAASTDTCIFESPTGKKYLEPLVQDSKVSDLCFSPDGKWLLVSLGKNKARILEVATGKAGASGTSEITHDEWVNTGKFSPSGRLIATGSKDRTARIWNVATGKFLSLQHDGDVFSARFSPNETLLVTASDDRTARLWDVTTGQAIGQPIKHGGSVNDAFFSPDGKTVITASGDKTVRVWDIQRGSAVSETLAHEKVINAVDFSPDGRFLATGAGDRARIWELGTDKPHITLEHTKFVMCLCFSPVDGKWLATGTEEGWIRVWNAATGQLAGEPFKGGNEAVKEIQFSPNGEWVMATMSHSVQIWDRATRKLVGKPMSHDSEVMAAAFDADGKRVITSCAGGTSSAGGKARIWDAATGAPLNIELKHPGEVTVTHAHFSPVPTNGDFIVTSSLGKDSPVCIWDAKLGTYLRALPHEDTVNDVSFSFDGKWVATASDDKTAQIWNVATGVPIAEPLKHDEKVKKVIFSPNSLLLLTISDTNIVRVWDAATGKLAAEPLRHSGRPITAAAFSPDGRKVVTAGDDKVAKVWTLLPSINPPSWMDQMAEAVGGYQLNDTGGASPITNAWETLTRARQRIAAPPADSFTQWGQWFLADRSTRKKSPSSSESIPLYARHLIESGNLWEALYYQPDNGLVLAKLAIATNSIDRADYYSRLAIQYEPTNAEVLWIRVDVLQTQDRNQEVYPAMEAAMAVEPRGVKTFGPDGAEFTQQIKEGVLAQGWLPKGWNDMSGPLKIQVTYRRLNDPPQPGMTALQMTAANPQRSEARLRGPRYIGKKGGKYIIEGFARSQKRSDFTVSARLFNAPAEKLADQVIRTTEQWKPFKVSFVAAKDFAADLFIYLYVDNSVDLAGVVLRPE